MNASTWIFGMRALPDDDGIPMHLVVFLGHEGVIAHELYDEPPSDAQLRALYDEAIDGKDGEAPHAAPKIVRVEDGPTAKRARGLFKRGARVELDRDAKAAIDEMVDAVVANAVGTDVFAALPDAWKDELVMLGGALDEAAPWEKLPAALLRASIPSLGVEDAHVYLTDRHSVGFLVFASRGDHARFRDAALSKDASSAKVPRIAAVELAMVAHGEEDEVLVANVAVQSAEGNKPATEADVKLCASLAHLLIAYVEAGPASPEPRALEVRVRDEHVRGTLTFVG